MLADIPRPDNGYTAINRWTIVYRKPCHILLLEYCPFLGGNRGKGAEVKTPQHPLLVRISRDEEMDGERPETSNPPEIEITEVGQMGEQAAAERTGHRLGTAIHCLTWLEPISCNPIQQLTNAPKTKLWPHHPLKQQ